MDIVADANILFSALIRAGTTAQLLVRLDFHLFAPEFIIEEFLKHKDTILSKTKRTEQEFYNFLDDIKEIITIIPKDEFETYIEKAISISPDANDVQYFALALKLNCPIWSNDKELKKQNTVKVISTQELINSLGN